MKNKIVPKEDIPPLNRVVCFTFLIIDPLYLLLAIPKKSIHIALCYEDFI